MAINSNDAFRQRDRYHECCEKAEKGNKYGADELKIYIKKQKELRKQREVQEYEQREQVLESKKQRLRELDLKCKQIAASKKLEKKTSVPIPCTHSRAISVHRFPSNSNNNVKSNERASSSSKPKVKRTKYTNQEPSESLEIKSSKSNCKLEREAANFIFKEFENIVRRECRNILKSRSSPTSITSVSVGENGKINAKEKEFDTRRRRVDKAVGTSFALYENDASTQPQPRMYENSSDSHSQNSDYVKPVSSSRALHSLFTDKLQRKQQQQKKSFPFVSRPTEHLVPEKVKHAAASKIQAAYKSYKIRSILSEAKLRAYKSFHSSNYNNGSSHSYLGVSDSGQNETPSNDSMKESRRKMNFFKPPSTRSSTSAQLAPEKPYDQSHFYPNSTTPLSFSIVNGGTTKPSPIKPNPENIPGYIPPPSSLSQPRASTSLSPRTLPLLRLKTVDEPFPKQALDSLDTSRQNIPISTGSPLKFINSISKFQLPYTMQGSSSKDFLPSATSVKVINENILKVQNTTNSEHTNLHNNKNSSHHNQHRRKVSKEQVVNKIPVPTPPLTTTALTNGDVKKYQKSTFVALPDPAFSTVLQEKIRLLKGEQYRIGLNATKPSKITTITTETTTTTIPKRVKSPTRKSMTAVSKATEQIKKKIVEAKQILEDYKLELLRSSSMSSISQASQRNDVTYESDFEVDPQSQSLSQMQNNSLYGHDSEILSSIGPPIMMNGSEEKEEELDSRIQNVDENNTKLDSISGKIVSKQISSISSILQASQQNDVTYASDFEADAQSQSLSQIQNSSLHRHDSEIVSNTPVLDRPTMKNESEEKEEELDPQLQDLTENNNKLDSISEKIIYNRSSSMSSISEASQRNYATDESDVEVEAPSQSLSQIQNTSLYGQDSEILTYTGPPTIMDESEGEERDSKLQNLTEDNVKLDSVSGKIVLKEISSMSGVSEASQRNEVTYESDFEVDPQSQSLSQMLNSSLHGHDSEILSSIAPPTMMNGSEEKEKEEELGPKLQDLAATNNKLDSISERIVSNRSSSMSSVSEASQRNDATDESDIEVEAPSQSLSQIQNSSLHGQDSEIVSNAGPPTMMNGSEEEEEKEDNDSKLENLVEVEDNAKLDSISGKIVCKRTSSMSGISESSQRNDITYESDFEGDVQSQSLSQVQNENSSLHGQDSEIPANTDPPSVMNRSEEEVEEEVEEVDPKLQNLAENNVKLDSISGKIVSKMIKEVIHERNEAFKPVIEYVPGIENMIENKNEILDEEDDSTHGEIDGEDEWFEDELVTTDPADDEKLKREAAEIVAEQLRIENEIRALEALQAQVPATLLNLSDKSPDKPPPPYSPPSSSDSLSLSTRSFAISCTSKQLTELISKQVEKSWNLWKESGKFPTFEMDLPDDKLIEDEENFVAPTTEKSRDPSDGDNSHHHRETSGDTPLTPQSCDTKEIPTSVLSTRAFNTLLFDLIQDTLKETLLVEDLESPLAKEYIDRIRPGSLALAAQKMRVPKTKENLIETVLQKIKNVLPYPILANVVPLPRRRLTKWTSRPRDLVDEVLAEELIEEDREWTESWPEEIIVLEKWAEKYCKRAVHDVIFAFKTVYSN